MKKLTMVQVAGVAAVSISAVLLLLGLFDIGPLQFFKLRDDDEAPIIVRNGSLDLIIQTARDGKWVDNHNATWSYETPAGKVHDNDFWVRADLTGNTHCHGQGHVVQIDYSLTSFHAIFTPAAGVNGSTTRTQIQPKPQIEFVNDQLLRHGRNGDGGHIENVKVDGRPLQNGKENCVITQANLVQVSVCSNPNKCQ
jgi:hypothetical protein